MVEGVFFDGVGFAFAQFILGMRGTLVIFVWVGVLPPGCYYIVVVVVVVVILCCIVVKRVVSCVCS